MDAAYISTLSALAGTVIGAVSTFTTSWMTTRAQERAARLATERTRRDELYSRFLEELSRLYSHAVTEEKVDYTKVVSIYALRGRILLQSSKRVVDSADEAIQRVMDIYLAPNRTDAEVLAHSRQDDPMKPFADACREELAAFR